jgi:hypothetical protein
LASIPVRGDAVGRERLGLVVDRCDVVVLQIDAADVGEPRARCGEHDRARALCDRFLSARGVDDRFARFVDEPHRAQRVGARRAVERRTALVFRVLEAGRIGDLTIIGPRTRAHFKTASGAIRAAIIQFKPGWSTPFDMTNMTVVVDRIASVPTFAISSGSHRAST